MQAVRRFEKPNLKFFDNVQIPSYVARPRENVTFGASKLTPNGLRPAEVKGKEKKGKQPPVSTPTGRKV